MDEGVCSTDLQSRPILLSVTRTGVRKSIQLYSVLPIINVFGYPLFFVYTVDKEAVSTSCIFAMLVEKVCVYALVKFDLCSDLQVYVRVSYNRWWPNTCIGGLLYLLLYVFHVQ